MELTHVQECKVVTVILGSQKIDSQQFQIGRFSLKYKRTALPIILIGTEFQYQKAQFFQWPCSRRRILTKAQGIEAVHIGFILSIIFQNNMPELVKRALEHLHRAQFEQAIQLFEQAMQMPNKIKSMSPFDCQLHLSTAYMELGRFQQCKQICSDLIAQAPHEEQPYINLSICLTHLKQFDKSLEVCNRMLMLNSRDWRFYLVRGYTQSHMGKYEEASNSYGIAITKNIYNNPRTYMLQAGCLAAMSESANAIKNMHYAQTALKDDEDRNCLTLYRYEISNIRVGLKMYEKYQKKIAKAQQQKLLKPAERTSLQTQLIKIVSRSVEYCMARHYKPTNNRVGPLQKQSQNGNINDIENSSQEGQRNFTEDMLTFENNLQLKTKVSITTKSSQQKIESNSGLACEWIRSKCAIF